MTDSLLLPVHVPVLLGPTAAGKTALAVAIAEAAGWEILSCDSRQVYRGMDIGTAKPDALQLARVRHHLVDLFDPDVSYSAFDFARDALRIIRESAAAGKGVLVCGGTGLYFEALRSGIAPQTATDPELRAALMRRAQRDGSAALHARLAEVDPDSGLRIHCNDVQRIVRALAVYEQTGKTVTELHRDTRPPEGIVFDVAAVMPPRELLNVRIEKRVDDMIARGLYGEFEKLLTSGYDASSPGMYCIGYRELFMVRRGECTLQTAVESIKLNTRRYARRQYTWFNAHNGKDVVPWTDEQETLRNAVTAALTRRPL